jgi:hypothetical protein
MPTAPDANDAPTGRSDPGKIGPLPIWGWALVGGGILAFFWWQRRQSAGAPTAIGDASSLPPGTGVTSTDPATADALLAAMQDLAKRLAGQGNATNPNPSNSPSPPAGSGGSSGQGSAPTLPSIVGHPAGQYQTSSSGISSMVDGNVPGNPVSSTAPTMPKALAVPYVPPVSTVSIPRPPTVVRRAWAPGGVSVVKPTPPLVTSYVSAPALNQMNPVSDYGRGN